MNKRIKRRKEVYTVIKENAQRFLVKVDDKKDKNDKKKIKVEEGLSLLECATNS